MHTGKMTLVSLKIMSHQDFTGIPEQFQKFGITITQSVIKDHLNPPGVQVAMHTTYKVKTDEQLNEMFTTLTETWRFAEVVPDFDPDNEIYKKVAAA